VAYKAEIQIVTKGQAQITQAQKALRQLGTQIDKLASGPGSLRDFNKVLSVSKDLLNSVQQGRPEEKRAIEQYVNALKNAATAQARQNRLIDEEIKKRGQATAELKKYNAAALPPRSRTSMTAAYMSPAAAIRAQRIDAEIEKRGGAAGIAATATSNVKKSQSIRKLRSDTQALNKALSDRLRLERKLAERGLMQLSSGKIAKGTDAGVGVQGPAVLSASQKKAEEALAIGINKTVKANIKKSQTLRRVRADTQALNKTLTNQLRLERQLAKRGLMQLSSGKIAKGTDAGVGVQGPAMAGPTLRQRILPTLSKGAKGLGRVVSGGLTGGLFPLLMGGGLAEGVGGAIGGGLGNLLGGPALGLAGSLAGQFIGEKVLGGEQGLLAKLGIGEAVEQAKALNNETRIFKEITEATEKIQSRISSASLKAIKARRKGNEELALRLEERMERSRLANEQFNKMTDLDNDKRNETAAGRKLIEQEKRRVVLETKRALMRDKEISDMKVKDFLLEKELQKLRFATSLDKKRNDVRRAAADGRFKVASAEISASLQINALEMQRAKQNKNIARQFDLQVKRANLLYQQTLLQVQQEQIRARLARNTANIELNRLRIELNKTASAGKDVTLARQSVALQAESLRIANMNVTATERAAAAQIRGAGALRTARIEQAQYERNLANQASNNVRRFATGGYVTRPTNAVIGEAGESEYVIPSSRMNSAMQRYSAGARGEAVTAGAAPAGRAGDTNYNSEQNSYYGGGGGASVNITTGPVLRMENGDYVSMADLQSGVATAVDVSQANMMRSLRRSYAARRSLGA